MSRKIQTNAFFYSISSQCILLAIASILLGVTVCRHYAPAFEGHCAHPQGKPAVIVELAGSVRHPGVYFFPSPPTAADILAAGDEAVPAWEKIESQQRASLSRRVASGTTLLLEGHGQAVSLRLMPMAGAKKIALGMALDLNAATPDDLIAIPGIGPTIAAAIISYRERWGPFARVEDVQKVKGIGAKKLKGMEQYVMVVGCGQE